MGLIVFVMLLGTFAKLSFLVVRGRSLARNTFAMGKLLHQIHILTILFLNSFLLLNTHINQLVHTPSLTLGIIYGFQLAKFGG